MKKYLYLICCLFCLCFLIGCPEWFNPNDYEDTSKNEFINDTQNKYFVNPSAEDNPDSQENSINKNEFLFLTNDTSLISKKGKTIWCLNENLDINKSFYEETVEETKDICSVTIVKASGSVNAPYGIILCESSQEVKDSKLNDIYLLCFLINTKQEFCLGTVKNNQFTKITEWTYCQSLNYGYGCVNTVSVKLNQNKQYEFYLNKSEVPCVSYKNEMHENRNYGKGGFVVTISSDEKYPNVATKVLFKVGE